MAACKPQPQPCGTCGRPNPHELPTAKQVVDCWCLIQDLRKLLECIRAEKTFPVTFVPSRDGSYHEHWSAMTDKVAGSR